QQCRDADAALTAGARTTLARDPFETSPDEPIVQAVQRAAPGARGGAPAGVSYWADSAFIAAAGIRPYCSGPTATARTPRPNGSASAGPSSARARCAPSPRTSAGDPRPARDDRHAVTPRAAVISLLPSPGSGFPRPPAPTSRRSAR